MSERRFVEVSWSSPAKRVARTFMHCVVCAVISEDTARCERDDFRTAEGMGVLYIYSVGFTVTRIDLQKDRGRWSLALEVANRVVTVMHSSECVSEEDRSIEKGCDPVSLVVSKVGGIEVMTSCSMIQRS